MKAAAECILTKERGKRRVRWAALIAGKNWDHVKTSYIGNENTQLMPTLRNLRKFKENYLTHTKNNK